MRQVPTNSPSGAASRILLIGTGQLSRHLNFYFSSIGLETRIQSSRELPTVATLEFAADVAFILVKDDALEAVTDRYKTALPLIKLWVHCSGSRTIPGVKGLHPLSSFGGELYSSSTYAKVPLIYAHDEEWSPELVFPKLTNPFYAIEPKDRAFYHALCVVAGNLPSLLWNDAFDSMESQLKLPREVLRPLIEQSLNNLMGTHRSLTGPIARGDQGTISRHLSVIPARLRTVYQSFVSAYLGESKK